jgi:hypothetical protein
VGTATSWGWDFVVDSISQKNVRKVPRSIFSFQESVSKERKVEAVLGNQVMPATNQSSDATSFISVSNGHLRGTRNPLLRKTPWHSQNKFNFGMWIKTLESISMNKDFNSLAQ